MSLHAAWQQSFGFFGSKPIVVEPVAAPLTSDAGLLPIRHFDEEIGLSAQFAAALDDPRHEPFVEHRLAEMLRMRIYGFALALDDRLDNLWRAK